MRLEIKDATLGYAGKVVLRDVNTVMETGRTTCVIGRNGAGKTTLFKSILGVLPLLGGEILFDGKNVRTWKRSRLAHIVAYVPQVRALSFPYTVFDVVLFGRTAYLSVFASPSKKDRIIAEECLEKLHIRHLKTRIFTRLSGGEQQMVIIARALAQQSSFLVMDEPTSGLDFGNQIRIINRVNELKNDALGILMATHSPDHAFMCRADTLVVHNKVIWRQGYCNSTVTEDVLKEIYGIGVKIHSIDDDDTSRKICVPFPP